MGLPETSPRPFLVMVFPSGETMMREGMPRTPYFLAKALAGPGPVGKGVPLHAGFLHVAHLVLGAAVGAYEDDFEILLVVVAELDQLGGKGTTGRAPGGGKVDSDGFACEGILGHLGSLGVKEGSGEQVLETGGKLLFG